MRRESHRRRGVYRASTGGWGHRAVYIGAVVAAAAVIAGFGGAVIVYGSLGLSPHQIGHSTTPVPPSGVFFGNAGIVQADQMDLNNTSGFPGMTWSWWNGTNFNGPCNGNTTNSSGYFQSDNNATPIQINGSAAITLVCLNSVEPTVSADGQWVGNLTATWYNSTIMSNSYNQTNFMPNGSYYNGTNGNITSCNLWNTTYPSETWNLTHTENLTTQAPEEICPTYYEMNANTSWLPSFAGNWSAVDHTLNQSTPWETNESGYAPNDLIYEIPVVFTNASVSGTYEISIGIEGITPVAQTFYFNDTIGGNLTASNDTVVFTFDMTAAWEYDSAVMINATGMPAPENVSAPLIYGAIGTESAVVTQCLELAGVASCPVANAVF